MTSIRTSPLARAVLLASTLTAAASCDDKLIAVVPPMTLSAGSIGFFAFVDFCTEDLRDRSFVFYDCKDETPRSVTSATVDGPFEVVPTPGDGDVVGVTVRATGPGEGTLRATFLLASGGTATMVEDVQARAIDDVQVIHRCLDPAAPLVFAAGSTFDFEYSLWGGGEQLSNYGGPPRFAATGPSIVTDDGRTVIVDAAATGTITSPHDRGFSFALEAVPATDVTAALEPASGTLMSATNVALRFTVAGDRALCALPGGNSWTLVTETPETCDFGPLAGPGARITSVQLDPATSLAVLATRAPGACRIVATPENGPYTAVAEYTIE